MQLSEAQGRAIQNANKRWNLLIGATRSGKSYTQQLLIPMRVQENIPGLYVLLAKTQGSVESNILAPMRELYGPFYVSHPRVRFGLLQADIFGKNFICLGGDNVRAIDKVRGKSIGYLAGDEGPTWTEDLMEMIKTRLTHPRAKADITGNPEGPFHPFKVDLIDRAKELGTVYHQPFLMDDNPSLDEVVKGQIQQELRGVWHRRLVLGEWAAAEGVIFPTFTIVKEDPEHIGQEWVGVDYGTTNPTVFYQVTYDPRLHRQIILNEWRYSSADHGGVPKTDADYSRDLQTFIADKNPRFNLVDPSAASFIAQLHRDGVRNLAHADNNVLDGIRRMASLFVTERLVVHERCKELIKELASYSWDPKAQKLGEDVPIKKNDHGPDAIRYVVNATQTLWTHRTQRLAA